jgi:hypothetical protein
MGRSSRADNDVGRSRSRQHPEFTEAISEVGVVEWGKGTYFTAFALAG